MRVNPCVSVDMAILRHNLNELLEISHSHGISVAVVTKVVCADPEIVALINNSEADFFADSRISNLATIQSDKPRMLVRIAMPSEAERVVTQSEISLQSEIATLQALGKAAHKHNKVHRVVLMIDMGDLREGIFYENYELIERTAQLIVDDPHLELYGVGVNLTCYGAIIPDQHNLGGLVELVKKLRARFKLPIPLVSGGNSSSIGLVQAGGAPEGITNLRLGEAFVLGNDTALCCLLPGLKADAFILHTELVEVQTKPSLPIGESGANAFGEKVHYEDKGLMRRGILAIGRQDINADTLIPCDSRVAILGASSDHLLVDLSQAPNYQVGDEISFHLDYGNLLRVFTSAYVTREYLNR